MALMGWRHARVTFVFFRATNVAVYMHILRNYQCYIRSSHSYNHYLTSGPLGPRQIVNYL